GKEDIVISSVTAGSLSVFLGNGDGTFQQRLDRQASGIAALTLADINGDGKREVMTTSSSGLNVLLGNGDGTFGAGHFYNAAAGPPSYLTAGDFNGDGHVDVVGAWSAGTGSIGVWLSLADGSLGPEIEYQVGRGRQVALGDFNEDQRTDVAVAGQNRN